MPLGVLPAVICQVNTTRLRHITKQMVCRDTAHFLVISVMINFILNALFYLNNFCTKAA
ncbi:Uncharacterised protein [Escherichia coli]|uniref:Uncharacterized protein n=1 Tax=Escherichia coli TaxID=562 RepID=A0A377B3W8_ECOLX|nr:Uncharacterised protein [Escherichia coli]